MVDISEPSFETQLETQFSVKQLENEVLKNKFNEFYQSEFENKRILSELNFNFDEIFEVSDLKENAHMLLVNQVNFSEDNEVNYGFAVSFDLEQNLQGIPMLIETVKIDENLLEITYFDLSQNKILSVKIDSENRKFDFENFADGSNNRILCGQNTMDCLQDAYTNHGWVSVWAFVQTAFIPATGAALAAACAALNCL
jgi:hypothetical protein